MSFWPKTEFSADLKNEQVKYVISNAFYYYFHARQGNPFMPPVATVSYIEYIPYNIIFTENSIFGEHLTPSIKLHSIPFAPLLDSENTFNELKSKINDGKITKGQKEGINGKVDIEFKYNKIERIGFNNWISDKDKLTDFSASFEIFVPIYNNIFLINKNLSANLENIIKEVGLVTKLK
ncbi:MAG: hypothetical protein KGI06_02355 [Candidatus Micrarchaeota archaeon]|nr:hypothetical protein [Candidatus Micrarchaeota archaeon]